MNKIPCAPLALALLVAVTGCDSLADDVPVGEDQSALTDLGSTQTTAGLTCKNVGRRWQVCGSASRSKLVLGAGIRFFKPGPDGTLVAASEEHSSCAAALADETVPTFVRDGARSACGSVFARATGALRHAVPVLVDADGARLFYDVLSAREKEIAHRAVTDLVSRAPDSTAIGCEFGPDFSISCWGGGYMCAAWVDEDGPGAQCWECEVADCN